MINVLIADNQFITCSGWKYILNRNIEYEAIDEVSDKTEMIKILQKRNYNFVIIDYTLFDFNNINELIFLQQKFDNVQWLIFSEDLNEELIKNLLLNSRNISILLKDCTEEEINTSLKEIQKGNRYICNHVSNIIFSNKSNFISQNKNKNILTITESEILKEISLGKTTKEIASNRHVSVHTIMTHRKNIFRKIEVNNVHEATKYAMRAGIVEMAEYYI